MVESGKGITFIPELAVMQLTEEQRQLVRPFAIPRPTRQVVLVTNKDFIRHSLLCVLKEEIKAAVPKEMLYSPYNVCYSTLGNPFFHREQSLSVKNVAKLRYNNTDMF